MKCTLLIAIILMSFPEGSEAGDKPTARAEYIQLERDWQSALGDFQQDVAASRLDKLRSFDPAKNPMPVYQDRFMELARKYPGDPSTIDCLVWVLVHPWHGPRAEKNYAEALETLTRDFIAHEKLGVACGILGLPFNSTFSAGGFHPGAERLLRAAADRSPHRKVRGIACFNLAYYFREESKHRPGGMSASAAASIAGESTRYFEKVIDQFSDIEVANKRTLGDLASAALFEARDLAVGRSAPEIEGEDLDGKPMKLSDFRGKVVVLNFWATWCGPCMAMVPHERDLVKRLENQPFVLLGVNGDADRVAARTCVAREHITWRSWDQGRDGPIIRRWNILGWPTIYVLDAQGIIRYRDIRGAELDEAVDRLIAESKL